MSLKKEKSIYVDIFILFLITRIVLLAFALFITRGNVNLAFYNFDVEQYFNIAINGYTEKTTVFFPLFPLLIKLFNVFGMPILGVMLVNNIAMFYSAILLYKITEDITSVKLFLCSPIAVFTFIAYTESIFLLLTFLVLYLYKKEKYLWAGISLGLGVCCRSFTVMLFFAIFIVMAIKFFKKEIAISPILKMYIPATILSLLYPIYLQVNFGSWRIFIDAQFKYWGRITSNIFSALTAEFQFLLASEYYIEHKIQAIYHFVLLVLVITLIVFSIKKILKEKNELNAICVLYLIFTVISLYSTIRAPYIMLPTSSFYRYFYGCISVYILPTMFTDERVKEYRVFYSFWLNIIISIIFARYYYLGFFMC